MNAAGIEDMMTLSATRFRLTSVEIPYTSQSSGNLLKIVS